jgi:membrane associated rhomboid family serine protease
MGVRLRYNSPVILTFTLISTAVLVIDSFTAGAASKLAFTVYPGLDLRNPLTYLRLFSHVIGHADWTHLMSNFAFILLIGPILEEKYGSLKTLSMMAVTAVVTGLLSALVFRTALRGASGIVFMFILLGSFTNSRQGEIPLTFILVVLLFLAREVINAVAVRDNVAQFAHIAGGVCGGMFGFAATRSARRPPRIEGGNVAPPSTESSAGTAPRP